MRLTYMYQRKKYVDFVILTEEIEIGCLCFELLNMATNKSKYIHELGAHTLKETYGTLFYDMYRWIRKTTIFKKF